MESIKREKVVWVRVDRSEYKRMSERGYVVRAIVKRKGPKGTVFEAKSGDLRRFYSGAH